MSDAAINDEVVRLAQATVASLTAQPCVGGVFVVVIGQGDTPTVAGIVKAESIDLDNMVAMCVRALVRASDVSAAASMIG